jgi:hypothetical protein
VSSDAGPKARFIKDASFPRMHAGASTSNNQLPVVRKAEPPAAIPAISRQLLTVILSEERSDESKDPYLSNELTRSPHPLIP